MHFKRLSTIVLLLVFVIIVAACGDQNEEVNEENEEANEELPIHPNVEFTELDTTGLEEDKIIAVYEGGEINGSQFASYLGFHGFINPGNPINDFSNREELLRFMILQQIIEEKSVAQDWAEEQAEEVWANFMEQYTDEQQQEAYTKLQTSEEELRDQLISYFLTEGYFRDQITEEDAQAYYQELEDQLTIASVRHILIATEETKEDGTTEEIRTEEEAKQIADDLYQQLQEGVDFAELAQEHSDDPGSKDNGGLYKDTSVAQWVEEFKQAALEQEIGEIGEPVQTTFGYHIIRVEDRQTTAYEELEDPIYGQLANEKVYDYFTNTLPDQIHDVNLPESEES